MAHLNATDPQSSSFLLYDEELALVQLRAQHVGRRHVVRQAVVACLPVALLLAIVAGSTIAILLDPA